MITKALQHFFGDGFQNVCLDKTGTDGIDAYPLGAQLPGPGFGKAYHPELAGRVIGLTIIAVQTHHAGSVQNGTAFLLQHHRGHGLSEVENRFQVHINHIIKLLLGHAYQLGVLGDPGIVHQHINAAKLLLHIRHHGVNLCTVRHIHGVAYGGHAITT